MNRMLLARTIAALFLAVAAALLVVGVAAERSAEGGEEPHQDAPNPTMAVVSLATHSEVGEIGETVDSQSDGGTSDEIVEHDRVNGEEADSPAETGEGQGAVEGTTSHSGAPAVHTEVGEGGTEAGELHNENNTILGIDPESNWAIAVAIAASLLLALAIWRKGTPVILFVAIAFGVLFAALDVREAVHQAAESRGGLVALALLIAGLHAVVAILASVALMDRPAGAPAAPG